MLRVCERYGQNPKTWPQTLTDAEFTQLVAQEVLRGHEERGAV